MKKNIKTFCIVWALLTVILNAIIFAVPNKIMGVTRFDKPAFWIAYALIMAADIATLVVALRFVKENSKEKKFLKIPLLYVAYVTLIVSIIVSAVFMVVPVIPAWIGAIICLVLLAVFIIASAKAVAAEKLISQIDENVKNKTAFIKMATLDAQTICNRATNESMKASVNKVYEALRYSDPMSSSELIDVEQKISASLNDLKIAVENDKSKAAANVVNILLIQIKERNAKCKALK